MTTLASPLVTSTTRSTTSAVAALTFTRTVAVEARKLVNTTAGLTLSLAAVPLMAVFAFGRTFSPAPDTTLGQVVSVASIPASWILMVCAVLLVATEFSRTAGITFTLDPHRGRVLAAKAAAVVSVALLATLIALGLGMAAALAGQATGHELPLTLDPTRLAINAGALMFTGLTALAWALLTRNAPAPIVVLLLWPTLAMLAANFSDTARELLSWINIDAVLTLVNPSPLVWAKLTTSVLFWIVLPGAIGAWRLLRGDL